MISITVFSLLLLAAFAVCGLSLPNENDDINSFDQTSNDNEVAMNFIKKNILSGIDSPELFCDDPHVAMCSNAFSNYTRPLHLRQAFPSVRKHLIDILSQPQAKYEVNALSIEKTLYQKCMNLGVKADSANAFATMKFVSTLFQKILNVDAEWQKIDDKLNLQGFDFTFFDVGVERDPENPRQHIIVLQPPSYYRIKDLYQLIIIAFDANTSQHVSKSLAWSFYDSIDQEAVQQFFRRWKEAFSTNQPKQEKIILSKWDAEYDTKASESVTSKINWQRLIKRNFKRVNIDVAGSENIIVRNKDYFSSLVELLGSTANELIVAVIKTKLIFENIRYIDWKYANVLTHRKRPLFCYKDTKLYGASYRLLRDLKKEESIPRRNYEILNTVVHNIANVTESAIVESSDLMPKEKIYLKAQVKLITSNSVKHSKHRYIVNDYYGDYKTVPSYFVSILKYRKVLKEKELSSLTHYSSHLSETEPFSLIDLAKPRNRFILNVFASSFLLSKVPIPSEAQKEVHYGIYGVRIASFLYGLLNENKFDNVSLHGFVDWYDHPNYPAKSLKCFVGEDVSSYGWSLASEAVTQIFGAHIAYKAMLKDYIDSQQARPKKYMLITPDSEFKSYPADQLFFMAYGKYHCELRPDALRTIFLNLDEYNSAFECEPKHGEILPKCSLSGFQIQRKRYFVNKSF